MCVVKSTFVWGAVCSAFLSSLICAQEKVVEPVSGETAITGYLYTGVPLAKKPRPQAQKRNYKVKYTSIRRVNGREVTLHEVEPPKINPVPVTSTRTTLPNPSTESASIASNKKFVPTEFIVVSSTVYGSGEDRLTKLIVWNRNQQITCWSNINGHLLTGFDQFKVDGQPYWMISTSGDALNLNNAAKEGCPVQRFRRGGKAPRFIIPNEHQEYPELHKIIANLHKLYRVEKQRLAAAHTERKRNFQLRSGLPTPPPVPPKPVTIRFWKRDLEKSKQERGSE